MALYQNIDGVWTECKRPYVKRNGAWTAVQEAYVRRSGNWVQAYDYDVVPPNPPEITLAIVEDFATVNGQKKLQHRWIKVGVRLPGASNDPDARLTRVLTDFPGNSEKAPTTQFGGTYTTASDRDFPGEPWSEWRYNGYGPHNDTSLYAYKQWPLNPNAGSTIIPGDRDYHFTGWSLDNSDNWSVATPHKIHVPKAGVDVPNVITKEARFQPNTSGRWKGDGFHSGDLVQQKSPRSRGLWFYGNQINDSVGKQTSGDEKVTVKSAQIFVRRLNDTGVANANIYLFWTPYGTVASLPGPAGSLTMHEPTKIGELAKGQGKWFKLPESYYGDLNKNINGMGLDWKHPAKADAFPNDFSQVGSVAAHPRCGELHVVWEEQL